MKYEIMESELRDNSVKPKVKIITHTPEPDKTVALSAKLCYSSVGVDEIEEGISQRLAVVNILLISRKQERVTLLLWQLRKVVFYGLRLVS